MRYDETRCRLREGSQKECYSFVTHSSLRKTQYAIQGQPLRLQAIEVGHQPEGEGELWASVFIVVSVRSKV